MKEVVFLLVFFAVFLFLIQNSFELMEAIYAVVGLAIDRTMSLFGSGGAIDLTAVSVVTEDDDVPALIALLLVSVISWVVVLGATSWRSWSAGRAPSSSTSWPRSARSRFPSWR